MEDQSDQPTNIRRRNSIASSVVVATELTLPSKPLHSSSLPLPHANGTVSTPPPLEFELLSLKSSLTYTSLKDLLPSTAVNSPAACASCGGSAYEISIRNRLVKQAAWAYLRPMSSSPDSSGTHFLRRLWLNFFGRNLISACFRFISFRVIPTITGAFDRILRAIHVWVNR